MTSNHINYIELNAKNLMEIKTIYSTCFGWNSATIKRFK
jgi:predicted enzyme related to lactoylglutathione lyase